MTDALQSDGSANPLRWIPEFVSLGRRRLPSQIRVMGSAILVGIVAGVGAIAFDLATRVIERYALGVVVGYEPVARPSGEAALSWLPLASTSFHPWLLLVVPTIGGILSGFLVYTFAPEAEGHGTDAVIAAYHTRQGLIRPRVPLIKIVASALTIGSGGSGGREGPVAQIGAGFGSLLANMLRMRPGEHRVLLAAGMGAGIAAIFRAPLAGALFASESLYWSPEFEPEVIIPAGLASVVSYCIFTRLRRLENALYDPGLDVRKSVAIGTLFSARRVGGTPGDALYAIVPWLDSPFSPLQVAPSFQTGDRSFFNRRRGANSLLRVSSRSSLAGRAQLRLWKPSTSL